MINIYNNASSKNAATLYANAAAAEAVIANMDADEYTTYKVRENNAGRFVIVVCDEDGYELGVI
jgi:roadblock/LC7 domain-containing protein